LYVKGSISVYSYLVFVNGNGYLQANIFGTGGSVALLAPSLWATNTWCHVAVTRQGNVFRLFVNGLIVSIITAPSSFGALVASAGPLSLANDTAGTYGWGAVPGYIDEFQIINGAAIYTQAFTPPAAPSTATAIDQVQGILQNLGGGRVASGNNLVLPSVIGSSLASYGASSQPPSAFIRGRRDYVYNANGYQGLIDGIVDYKATPFNVPVSRRVRLHRQADGLLIREVFSDPITGEYKFDYIDETQKYFVCSLDHTGAFRAVISDNLTPTIMSGAPIAYPPAHYRSVGPVATYQAGPGTTVVPSTPTGMTVGDLMIASIANMICTVTPPVGWTLVNSYSMNNGANTQQVMLSVYSKYATSADVAIAAHTFSFSATSTQGATGVITAFYNPAGLPVVVDTSAVNGYLVGNASTPPQQSQTMIFTPMRVTNNNSHIMLVTAQAFMGTTFNAGTGLILRAGSTAGGIGVCTGTSNLQSGYENGVGYNGYMMTWNNVATQPAIGIGLILTT
jgi:hypothetical protein